ncbi:MAG TPA: hypothetical protein VLS89_11740, partial [Candidatus Nanopelagicales bacterium]|nr:hypothetical protein [Candidatus Nanopelagicales bacterium]
MARALGPIGAALAALASGCAYEPSALDAHGPGAARIAWLFWFFVVATGVPAALTIGLFLHGSLRRRGGGPPPSGRWVIAGVGVTAAIIGVLIVASSRVGAEVAEPDSTPGLTIDVRGHRFWWEVRYPDQGVTTANEL